MTRGSPRRDSQAGWNSPRPRGSERLPGPADREALSIRAPPGDAVLERREAAAVVLDGDERVAARDLAVNDGPARARVLAHVGERLAHAGGERPARRPLERRVDRPDDELDVVLGERAGVRDHAAQAVE